MTLVNHGLISSNVQYMTIYVVPNTLTNTGTLQATNGGNLTIQPSNPWTNNGLVCIAGSSAASTGTFMNSGMLALHGQLNVTGSLSLLGSSQLAFTLGGVQQGSDYGSAQVNGIATLGGLLELSFTDSFQLQLSGTDTFVLLSSTTALDGTFANVQDGGELTTQDGGYQFQVYYGPSSPYGPDSVVVTNGQSVVPEPGTWEMLAAGAGALFFLRPRRQNCKATNAGSLLLLCRPSRHYPRPFLRMRRKF